MPLRTKLVFALLIFGISYVTKSLQAVDLASVMYTNQQPFGGLTDGYHARAVSILKGEGLLGPYDIKPSRTGWLAQAPGYSVFLSGIYSITGIDFFRVQVIQNGVNSLSPILIFLIAGSLLSWRVGVVSGLLSAVSHQLSHISNFILPDSVAALPLLAAVYVVVLLRPSGRNSFWLYILAGVMIGLAAWLRSQLMLIGPFLILILVVISIRRMSVLKRGAVMALVSFLVIAPITIKNYIVYGEFVPINIGAGIVLWEGIADASGDRFGAVAYDDEVARQEAIIYNNPHYAGMWSMPDGIMRDRDRVKKSLAIIVRHPFWYAGVMLDRCNEMVKYTAHAPLVYKQSQTGSLQPVEPVKPQWESVAADSSVPAFALKLGWMRAVIRPLQRVTKEAMRVFVMIGVVIMFLAAWRRALFLFAVPLYYFIFQSFMHTEFRYTLPMQYFLFVFAAVVWVLLGALAWRGIKRLTDRFRPASLERA